MYEIPGVKSKSGLLAAFANGWTVNGVIGLQSGQPYNVYDFSGAVAGQINSTTINIADPIIGFTPGVTMSQLKLQGTTGVKVLQPLFDTTKLYIPTLAPGTNGVPPCATVNGAQVCDTYESGYSATGRNTFRGPFQTRFDVAFGKSTRLTEKIGMQVRLDIFNVMNHPDFDVPSASTSLYSVTKSGNAIKAVTVRAPSATLGLIQQTLGGPRVMQVSAHFRF